MAAHYQHILLATDLAPDNDVVAERAQVMAQFYGAKLSILHVVDAIPLYFGNELVLPETQEIEAAMVERSKERLAALTAKLGLPAANGHVRSGVTKLEILGFVEAQGVDLIVVGSHTRHGLGHLLGSTANAVLHSAPCDVLAVRVAEPK